MTTLIEKKAGRRLRIVFCIPNFAGGGAEKIAAEIACGLDASLFDVTLFVHEKNGSLVGRFEDKVRVIYASERRYTRWRLPALLLKTAPLVKNADIVVGANEGRATALSLMCALLYRKRFISWIHCDWSVFSRYVSWRARLALYISRFSNQVVVVSKGAANAFKSLVPIESGKLFVYRMV